MAETKQVSVVEGNALDQRKQSIARDLINKGIMPGTAEYQRAYKEALETGPSGGARGKTGTQPARDTRLASVLAALNPNNRMFKALIASGQVKPGS